MKNKDMPAMPFPSDVVVDPDTGYKTSVIDGLTKAEYARIHEPAMPDWWIEIRLSYYRDCCKLHKAWLDHCVKMALGGEE